MKSEFLSKYWVYIFVGFCFLWGFWGCWKIKDLLFNNIEILTTIDSTLRQELQEANWITSVLFIIAFVTLYLFWVMLPLLLLGFWWAIKTSTKTTLAGKVTYTLKDFSGQAIRGIGFLVIWFSGAIFIGYYKELIDLAGWLILIGIIIYFLAIWLIRWIINR